MMNRSIAPELHTIEKIDFQTPEKLIFAKDKTLIVNRKVQNETARVDFYFDAGSAKGAPLTASLCAGLIFSGTDKLSSTAIHAKLDGLGAFFDISNSHESAVISFYALRTQMPVILSFFKEVVENAVFPDNEINELIADRKQKHLVNLEKMNFLVQREFQRTLFQNTEYGNLSELTDFEKVESQSIREFFKTNYLNGLFKIVVVGDFDETFTNSILSDFQNWSKNEARQLRDTFFYKPDNKHIEREKALQTAIRVGKLLFNKTHPDYHQFVILNTILGDYFGSRLMKNIREDKGYTYGIGSYLSEFRHTAFFAIATEVGKDVKDAAIKEIQSELQRLQDELIPEEELGLVRNYLEGQSLKSADGPYSMTDLFVQVDRFGLSMDFYNDFLSELHRVSPEDLREIARKHLQWNSLSIITAG